MEDLIKQRAYQLWEADGCPHEQDQSYWFKAMAEIAAVRVAEITPPRKRVARTKKAA